MIKKKKNTRGIMTTKPALQKVFEGIFEVEKQKAKTTSKATGNNKRC